MQQLFPLQYFFFQSCYFLVLNKPVLIPTKFSGYLYPVRNLDWLNLGQHLAGTVAVAALVLFLPASKGCVALFSFMVSSTAGRQRDKNSSSGCISKTMRCNSKVMLNGDIGCRCDLNLIIDLSVVPWFDLLPCIFSARLQVE